MGQQLWLEGWGVSRFLQHGEHVQAWSHMRPPILKPHCAPAPSFPICCPGTLSGQARLGPRGARLLAHPSIMHRDLNHCRANNRCWPGGWSRPHGVSCGLQTTVSHGSHVCQALMPTAHIDAILCFSHKPACHRGNLLPPLSLYFPRIEGGMMEPS